MTMKGKRVDDVSIVCSNAVSPILLSFAAKGQHSAGYLGKQISKIIYKLGALYASLLASLVSVLSHGPWGVLLSLGVFGMTGLIILSATFKLGRTIAEKVHQVICTTDDSGEQRSRFSYGDLQDLPAPVQRYLTYCMPEGQPRIKYCAIKQHGWFRIRENPGLVSTEGWKKVRANQYFSTEEPAYVWDAYIWLAPLVWIRGWDCYLGGKGELFWRLFSCFTLVDFGGPEIDQSALVRYLSEACYYPTALLPSHRLRWTAVDDNHAKATLMHAQQKVSGVFEFNSIGQIVSMCSEDRSRQLGDGSSSQDKWTGYYSNWAERAGIMIPLEMESVWNLISGRFSFARLTVVDYKCFSRIGRTSMCTRR
ncbi:hypothetical protein ABBQ38_003810 [Trebouxia sp. C0009 RCD-2024]